jgi:hypothetical protein
MDDATLEGITSVVLNMEEEIEEINRQIAIIQQRVAELDLDIGRMIWTLKCEMERRKCPPSQ